MIVFVCRIDGSPIGEFGEEDFRNKVFAREIKSDDYYWHEGMAGWRAVAEYRALAKTQRISFAPPVRPTIKIEVNQLPPAKPSNLVSKFLNKLRRRK